MIAVIQVQNPIIQKTQIQVSKRQAEEMQN